jgi:hypothetical protein
MCVHRVYTQVDSGIRTEDHNRVMHAYARVCLLCLHAHLCYVLFGTRTLCTHALATHTLHCTVKLHVIKEVQMQ